jgi:hypothetical protein
MDNRRRAINYVRQNYPIVKRKEPAATIVDRAMDPEQPGSLAQLLTGPQRKRIQRHRGGEGVHRQRQRAASKSRVSRRLAHYAALFGPKEVQGVQGSEQLTGPGAVEGRLGAAATEAVSDGHLEAAGSDLARPCEKCGALAGERCKTASGKPAAKSHSNR